MIVRMNVPVATDGTHFRPNLICNGTFTVGDKMAEQRFADFNGALAYLKSQPKARWRRPNSKGNRGIVTAVSWEVREIDLSEVSSGKRRATVRATADFRQGDFSSQPERRVK